MGHRVVVAGSAPNWPDGHVDPDVEAQSARRIEIMLTALEEAEAIIGSGIDPAGDVPLD